MTGGSMGPEHVLKLWHHDKAYNDFTYNDFTYNDFTYNDFTYNDFIYNGNTSSPTIQLANFYLLFYFYMRSFISKFSYN